MQMEQIDVAGTDKNLQTYPVVSSPRRLMPGPSLLIQLKAKVVVKSINNTIRSSQKTPAGPSCSSSHHRFSVGLSLLYVIPEKSKKRRKEPTSSSRMPSFYFALVIRTYTQAHMPSKLQRARLSSVRGPNRGLIHRHCHSPPGPPVTKKKEYCNQNQPIMFLIRESHAGDVNDDEGPTSYSGDCCGVRADLAPVRASLATSTRENWESREWSVSLMVLEIYVLLRWRRLDLPPMPG